MLMFQRVSSTAATMLVAFAAAGTVAVAAPSASAQAGTVANVADRGASAYAPEDTVAAITEAKNDNAKVVRLDVRATKDGKLVLLHDASLARTTNVENVFPGRGPWNVSDFTLAEVQQLDAGSWFDSTFAGEPVPTLTQALSTAYNDGLGVILDVAVPTSAQVAKSVQTQQASAKPTTSTGTFYVESSDQDFLKSFHKLLPWVPTGFVGTPAADQLTALAKFVDLVDVPRADVTADYVTQLHQKNLKAFAWTVNDEDTMRSFIAAGVDGIATTRPDALNTVLTTPAS